MLLPNKLTMIMVLQVVDDWTIEEEEEHEHEQYQEDRMVFVKYSENKRNSISIISVVFFDEYYDYALSCLLLKQYLLASSCYAVFTTESTTKNDSL